MKSRVLFFTVLAVLMQRDASADLFATLDSDGNGIVTRTELSEKQQTYFDRALRVSDQNGDGALSRSEFEDATADPQPVQVNTSLTGPGAFRNGQRPSGGGLAVDPSRFDRNGDDYISEDEIPAALKPRLAPVLNRFDTRGIPVNVLKQYVGRMGQGQSDRSRQNDSANKSDKASSDRQSRSMQSPDKARGPGRMQQTDAGARQSRPAMLFDRMDSDQDGKVNRQEQQRFFRMRKSQNRNQDGEFGGGKISTPSSRK